MPSILNQYSRIGGSSFGNGRGVTYIPNGTNAYDTSTWVTTNRLVPERVSTWEVGYKGTIGGKLFIDFNSYYGISKNFLGKSQSVTGRAKKVGDIWVTHNPFSGGQVATNGILTGANFTTFFNYGEVANYGVDAGLNYMFNKKINLAFRYSWFGSDITKNNLKNDANKDQYVSPEERSMNAPQNRAVAILNLQDFFRKKTYATISARWVERYEFYSGNQIGTIAGKGKRGQLTRPGLPTINKNFDHGPLGGFTTIDLSTGFQLNEMVKLGMGITNLFNTEQIEFVGSPSIGRLIMFEVRVHVPNRK
jgi:outer membrane receptor for ferrienterochelin and colicins